MHRHGARAGTLDLVCDAFGPTIPASPYLLEGYAFENAVRYPDGSVTLT